MGFPGFGFGRPSIISVIVPIFFVVIIVIIAVVAAKSLSQWNRNNHSPRLTVEAHIVGRREEVTHHHHHDDSDIHYTHHSTTYYVTFEVESGDRMEFVVPDTEYGYLIEGDWGRLTFQGTRYLCFERQ